MSARTGKQFLEGLRDNRKVWLAGRPVDDVTTHPSLKGAASTLAALYDFQHEQANVCLMHHPTSNERINVCHILPRSKIDLQRRHKAIEAVARYSNGMLGRSPDYLNITFAGFAARSNVWASHGNEEGASNLVAFQEELAHRDLFLTHAIVDPTVDRSLGKLRAANGEVALHKVGNTEHGILVSGARVLATSAPFADEIAVYPGVPIPLEATRNALAFSIPVNTPGISILCRDSFSRIGCAYDVPYSRAYDEQDTFIIFDNVEVPRNRVFIDGKPELFNLLLRSGWLANIMQQTSIRAAVKLEFAYRLATDFCQAVQANDPAVRQLLGEIWSYCELTRSAVAAAEVGAHDWGNGAWFCDERPFRALAPILPSWFPRVNEIISILGSHNLIATPCDADFANTELQPLLDLYFRGGKELRAVDRVRCFRAAWDFVGSSLGNRNLLYERFYLGPAWGLFEDAHLAAQRARESASEPSEN